MTDTSINALASTRRGWDVVAHGSSLIFAANVAAIAGTAYGWIAFLLPLGPLIVTGVMQLATGTAPRGIRSLLGFTIISGAAIGVGWVTMASNEAWPLLTYIFPLALLLFTLGLVNFILITVSRAVRAWKGLPFDYPWIIGPVRRIVGLGDVWEE